MLSKNDYLGYLKEMFDIENKMVNIYSDLEERINDREIKNIFSRLVLDERSHANAINVLVELIKQKYPQGSR